MQSAACQLLQGLVANRIESIAAVLRRAPVARMRALAHMAFGEFPPLDVAEVPVERVPPDELFGFQLRHVGVARPEAVRVHPALLPSDHVLARIPEGFEGILVHGDAVGDMLLASQAAEPAEEEPVRIQSAAWDPSFRFYVRVALAPIPGAMGLIASMLDSQGIPLEQVVSKSELLVLSGVVPESRMIPAFEQIARSPVVLKPPLLVRVLA